MKIEIVLASALALLSFQPTFAQAPPASGQEPKKEGAQAQDASKTEAKVDPEVDAWVQILAQKIGDKNETIRRSAERALQEVGKPALATLQKIAADTKDATRSDSAKRLITRIENPQAGGPGGRGAMGGGGMDPIGRALEGIELSKEQQAKVDEVKTAYGEKVRALMQKMQSGELDREGMTAAQTELRKEVTTKLKGVLTEEQVKKVEEALAAPRGGRRGGGGGGGGGR
jgi:hypothetical protein